jgi:hypothetical protein
LAYGYKELVLNTLVGNTEIKDALGRIEKLTQEEALIVAAEALDVAHRVHNEVVHVASVVEGVYGKVKGIDGRVNGIDDRVKCIEGKISPFREILDSEQLFEWIIHTVLILCAEAIDQMKTHPTSIDST